MFVCMCVRVHGMCLSYKCVCVCVCVSACVYVFVCVCVQAARGPAACGRVLPGSDVPDEDSVHGLLLQPPTALL